MVYGNLRKEARRWVTITLADGAALEGELVVPVARPIGEVLNGPRAFFEFEASGGAKIYLARSAIRSVQVRDMPQREARGRPAAA